MIDLTIFVFIIFIIFLFLGEVVSKPFIFALGGFFAVITGIVLAVSYVETAYDWAFSIIGFALFLFGVWQVVRAYEDSLEG